MQSLVSSNSLVLPFSTFLLFPVIQAWFFISLLWLHPLVLVPFVLHACTFYLIFSLSFLCLFLLLSSFESSPVSLTVSSSFTSPYLFFAPCSCSSILVSFSPISFCFSPFLLYSHVQFLFSSLFTLPFPFPAFLISFPNFSFPITLPHSHHFHSYPHYHQSLFILYFFSSPFSPSCLLYASVLWPMSPYLSHFFFTVFYSLISSSFHFLFQLLAFSLCPPALLTSPSVLSLLSILAPNLSSPRHISSSFHPLLLSPITSALSAHRMPVISCYHSHRYHQQAACSGS